ncbi:hypothetical protein [Bacillus marinisedimentorum]|nr:hypothetical protein [Bacillus marinisedimentorum]
MLVALFKPFLRKRHTVSEKYSSNLEYQRAIEELKDRRAGWRTFF